MVVESKANVQVFVGYDGNGLNVISGLKMVKNGDAKDESLASQIMTVSPAAMRFASDHIEASQKAQRATVETGAGKRDRKT